MADHREETEPAFPAGFLGEAEAPASRSAAARESVGCDAGFEASAGAHQARTVAVDGVTPAVRFEWFSAVVTRALDIHDAIVPDCAYERTRITGVIGDQLTHECSRSFCACHTE